LTTSLLMWVRKWNASTVLDILITIAFQFG
jgi:hypothetical protein